MKKTTPKIIEKWLKENTHHNDEFSDIKKLVKLKQKNNDTISIVLPTLNEEKTIGKIVKIIKEKLVKEYPLIDEIIVIDSGSEDNTRINAEKAGAKFFRADVYSDLSNTYKSGKGTNLWTSLYLSNSDIICWIDADIHNFDIKFVYGLIGPLLTNKKLAFSKGFYKRPIKRDNNNKMELISEEGGRVTELCFRPLINLFFPELTGFIQPLSGEYAGRRHALEKIPFYSGYNVETGILINLVEKFGLNNIVQVDLDLRIHNNQPLINLNKMANAITKTIIKEAKKRKRTPNLKEPHYYRPHSVLGQANFEEILINEIEFPPIITTERYKKKQKSSKNLNTPST